MERTRVPRTSGRVVLFGLCVVLCFGHRAWGFNSFEWWGGAAHLAMLQDALMPLGFMPDAVDAVRVGADSQDSVLSRKFTASPHHHCDDNKIPEAWTYIQDRLDTGLLLGGDAPMSPDLADSRSAASRALYALGEGLHTLQDFYCHSNYVETALVKGLPYAPVDWNNRPAGVKSGQFYWSSLVNNEGTTMKQVPRELVNDGKLDTLQRFMLVGEIAEIRAFRKLMIQAVGEGFRFHSDDLFGDRMNFPEYEKALHYATDAFDVLHYEIAKDYGGTLQGRVIAPDGRTLFDKARELAILDTAAQWRRLEDRLRNDGGTQAAAAWTVAALKGRDLPEAARAVIRAKPRVLPGEVYSGEVSVLIRNVSRIGYDAARPFKARARLHLTTTPGFGAADKRLPENDAEPGLSDGIHTVPLEAFGLKAPGEPGAVTLKLEVCLAGDPRGKACFAEATVDVNRDATPTSGAAGAKFMWLRGKPVMTGFGDPSTTATPTSLVYTGTGADGKPATNTLTWDEPPTVLRDGDLVSLRMSASAVPGASVGGWYNLGDVSNRSDSVPAGSLNGAGSQGNFRLPASGGSPHLGVLKLTFRPGYAPWIQVSVGHDPGTKTWGLVTWTYERVADDGRPSTAAAGAARVTNPPTTAPTFAGTWKTTWGDWGEIVLVQEGNRVTGSYGGTAGTLEGTVDGRVLRLKWKERDGALWGGAKFTLSEDGKTMQGSRNDYKDPDVAQYRWDAARL